MKRTKKNAPAYFSLKLTALFFSALFFTACSSSSPEAQPASETASSQPVVQESSSATTQPSATEAGTPVALDDSQVQETQTLVQDAQAALATAQLSSLTPSADASSAAEDNSVTSNLSAQTQDEILKIATGSAADDFMATAYEYLQNGWKVEGKPIFTGEPKISSTTFNGADAKRLEVCVDSSTVRITDDAGNSMLPSSAPQRSLTYYTLVQSDNTWKIASIDFPANPDC